MIYSLPTKLNICGTDYEIRTDYRVILELIEVLNDPAFSDDEKAVATIETIIIDWENVADYSEALEKCFWFIDLGQPHGKKTARLVDWEKDFPYIIAPVNRVLGYECRSAEYLHWWTFMGAYMEISEGLFHEILQIRQKKMNGKKLEKWELEFYRKNKKLIDLQGETKKRSAEEEAALKELFGLKR